MHLAGPAGRRLCTRVRAIRSAALCGVDVDLHRVCRRLLERLQQEPGVILGVVRRPVLAELEHMRDVVLVLAVDTSTCTCVLAMAAMQKQ